MGQEQRLFSAFLSRKSVRKGVGLRWRSAGWSQRVLFTSVEALAWGSHGWDTSEGSEPDGLSLGHAANACQDCLSPSDSQGAGSFQKGGGSPTAHSVVIGPR
jgi:hypothetical protein